MDLDDDGLLLFILDLIQTVPSLKFLQQSKDFHIPYAKTVIQRLGRHIYSHLKKLDNTIHIYKKLLDNSGAKIWVRGPEMSESLD